MKYFFLFTLLLTNLGHACVEQPETFAPESFVEAKSGITEEEAEAVITAVTKIYGPLFAREGRKLQVNNNWYDDQFQATSFISEDYRDSSPISSISMHGGLARHPLMTKDVYLGVLCHEIGHFRGGEPRFTAELTAWASGEGQSDFFSSYECVKKVMRAEKVQPKRSFTLAPEVLKTCDETFSTLIERQICKRTAQSALDYGKSRGLQNFKLTVEPVEIAEATMVEYPSLECRVQTKYLGALCKDSDCPKPACWYKSLD